MKIFKSIKWRLQIWYGLILVGVLAGFGFTAYHLERERQFDRIDNELHRRVGCWSNSLHRPPHHRLESDFDRPPPDQWGRRITMITICRERLKMSPPSWKLSPAPFHLSPEARAFF